MVVSRVVGIGAVSQIAIVAVDDVGFAVVIDELQLGFLQVHFVYGFARLVVDGQRGALDAHRAVFDGLAHFWIVNHVNIICAVIDQYDRTGPFDLQAGYWAADGLSQYLDILALCGYSDVGCLVLLGHCACAANQCNEER